MTAQEFWARAYLVSMSDPNDQEAPEDTANRALAAYEHKFGREPSKPKKKSTT